MEYREYMEQQCVEANFHDQLLQLAEKTKKRSPEDPSSENNPLPAAAGK